MAANRNSTTVTAPSDIPQNGKHVRYNRETMDHDFFYDGRYLGSRESRQDAVNCLNEYIYDLTASGELYSAVQMDAPVMPANPSPLLLDLIDWSEKEAQAYSERFAAGFRDGQAIAAALTWPEQKAEMYAKIDAVVADRSLSPEEMGQRCAALIADYEPQDVERIPATLASLPPIEAQIAAIPPMSTNGAVDILAVTLPDGIELTRCTFNGAPAEWVEIYRDEVGIDIRGDGSISGIQIGEHYLDDVPEADWEALRLLLAVDRQAIGRATQIPTPVLDAMYAWNHQPYADWVRNHETSGFGGWYEKRRRLVVKAA